MEIKKGSGHPIALKAARITTSSFLFSVKCIRSTAEYFAERLFKAMKVRGGVDAPEVGERGSVYPHKIVGTLVKCLGVHWPKRAFRALAIKPSDGALSQVSSRAWGAACHTPSHPTCSHDCSGGAVTSCPQSSQPAGLEAHALFLNAN